MGEREGRRGRGVFEGDEAASAFQVAAAAPSTFLLLLLGLRRVGVHSLLPFPAATAVWLAKLTPPPGQAMVARQSRGLGGMCAQEVMDSTYDERAEALGGDDDALTLRVRRGGGVLGDVVAQIRAAGDDLAGRELAVEFEGEDGEDGGGLLKEFLHVRAPALAPLWPLSPQPSASAPLSAATRASDSPRARRSPRSAHCLQPHHP